MGVFMSATLALQPGVGAFLAPLWLVLRRNQDARPTAYTNERHGRRRGGRHRKKNSRCYERSGVLRLCCACLSAKTKCNTRGLESLYPANEHRSSAHSYVLHSLSKEFSDLIRLDPASPNGCRFTRKPQARVLERELNDEASTSCESLSDSDHTAETEEDDACRRKHMQQVPARAVC